MFVIETNLKEKENTRINYCPSGGPTKRPRGKGWGTFWRLPPHHHRNTKLLHQDHENSNFCPFEFTMIMEGFHDSIPASHACNLRGW
jgi:hypothetical protein